MPKPSVAVITQHAAYFPSFMVVVNYQRPIRAANNTLFNVAFNFFQELIRHYPTVYASADFIAVCSPTLPAPAVQPIDLLVVRREEFSRRGLAGLAPGAG